MSLEHSPGRTEGWPIYLSVRQVAFELGLSTRRIYQLADAGELKAIKIGAVTRITSASLLALAQRADAGELIAEFVRGRPKATVGRKGVGLRKARAPVDANADSSPPQRKPKGARKHRRAARAAAKPEAEGRSDCRRQIG